MPERAHGFKSALSGLLLALLIGGQTHAETAPLLSIELGQGRLQADAGQILMVQVQAGIMGPAVVVTLDDALKPQMQALTTGHVGEEIIIRVCGVVASRPKLWAPINDATFAVQGDDLATSKHLAAVLRAKSCDVGPSS